MRSNRFRLLGFRPTRHLAVALAFLVALQGLAVGVIGTLGRLHTHDAGQAATIVVLDDLRRSPAHGLARGEEAASRHGHSHAAGAALRHPHRGDDASVTLAPGEPLQGGGDADAGSAGAALAALVALVPVALSWVASAPGEQRAAAAAWVAQTRPPDPFERPPRPA